jgi:transcriptional regulator with XRE-family HTH domain
MTEKEKLEEMSLGTSLGWLDDAEFVDENEMLLEMSAKAALAIIKVMKQQHLTKRDLAQMLDISPQSVSKQLSGNANFTFETLQKYGRVLGLNFDIVPKFKGQVVFEEDRPSTKIVYTFQAKGQSSSMQYNMKECLDFYEWMS